MENSTSQNPFPARQEILRQICGLEREPNCALHKARRLLAGQSMVHPEPTPERGAVAEFQGGPLIAKIALRDDSLERRTVATDGRRVRRFLRFFPEMPRW